MTESTRRRVISLALFAVWLVVVVCAAWRHALWRDEVRAVSIALDGPNILAMLKGLREEGHPALWYLLLRGAHTLLPRLLVVQLVALLVAVASALLLLLYSPFNWALKALLLAGNAFLFEYSVMARNYGISMLILFLLAIFYKRHRDRGPLLGILLFLLANCNAPSVLLAGGFLLFWLVDAGTRERANRPRALRTLGWNAAIAIVGVAASILTILPASHGSMAVERPGDPLPPLLQTVVLPGRTFEDLLKGIFLPGEKFEHLMVMLQQSPSLSTDPYSPLSKLLLSVILFGSTLGLIRYPGAFLAALATLVGLSLFFTFSYLGAYRHEALWLCFLIGCYWITSVKAKASEPRISARWQAVHRSVSTLGWGLFLLLMAMQVPIGVGNVLAATSDGPPFSCSRDLGVLIRSMPELRDAILIAEPDSLLESLRYYVSNPTYLVREQRFGNFVSPESSRSQLTLDDVLANARSLHAAANKPVLILLAYPLDPFVSGRVYRDSRNWEFLVTPEQERVFMSATRLIESFPAAVTDEHFDVYLLK